MSLNLTELKIGVRWAERMVDVVWDFLNGKDVIGDLRDFGFYIIAKTKNSLHLFNSGDIYVLLRDGNLWGNVYNLSKVVPNKFNICFDYKFDAFLEAASIMKLAEVKKIPPCIVTEKTFIEKELGMQKTELYKIPILPLPLSLEKCFNSTDNYLLESKIEDRDKTPLWLSSLLIYSGNWVEWDKIAQKQLKELHPSTEDINKWRKELGL